MKKYCPWKNILPRIRRRQCQIRKPAKCFTIEHVLPFDVSHEASFFSYPETVIRFWPWTWRKLPSSKRALNTSLSLAAWIHLEFETGFTHFSSGPSLWPRWGCFEFGASFRLVIETEFVPSVPDSDFACTKWILDVFTYKQLLISKWN